MQLLSIFQSSTASGDLCWITLDRCCMGCNYRGRLHTGKNTFSCVWDRKGRVNIIFFTCFFSLKGRTSLQKKCKKILIWMGNDEWMGLPSRACVNVRCLYFQSQRLILWSSLSKTFFENRCSFMIFMQVGAAYCPVCCHV